MSTTHANDYFLNVLSQFTNVKIRKERKDNEIVLSLTFDLDPELSEGPAWMMDLIEHVKTMDCAKTLIREGTEIPPSPGVKPKIIYEVELVARFTKNPNSPMNEDRIFDFPPYLRSLEEQTEINDVQEKGATNPFGHHGNMVDIQSVMEGTSDEYPIKWTQTVTGMLEQLEWELKSSDRYSDYTAFDKKNLNSILRLIEKAHQIYGTEKLELATQCFEKIKSLKKNAGIKSKNELRLLIERINSNHYRFDEECYDNICKYFIGRMNAGMHGSALVDDIYSYLYHLDTYERKRGLPIAVPDPNDYPIKQIVHSRVNQIQDNIGPENSTHDDIQHENQTYHDIDHGSQTHYQIDHGNQTHDQIDNGNQTHDGIDHGNQTHDGIDHGNQTHDCIDHGNQTHDGIDHGNQTHDGIDHGNQIHDGIDHGNQTHDGIDHGNQTQDGIDHGNQTHDGIDHGNQTHDDIDQGIHTHSGGPRQLNLTHSGGPRQLNQTHSAGPRQLNQTHSTGPRQLNQTHSGGLRQLNLTHSGGPRQLNQTHSAGPRQLNQTHSAGPRQLNQTHSGGPRQLNQTHSVGPRQLNQTHSVGPRQLTQAVAYIVDTGKELAISWREWELTSTGMLKKLESELTRFGRYSAYMDENDSPVIDTKYLNTILEDIQTAYEEYDDVEKLQLLVRCLKRLRSLLRSAGVKSKEELKLLIERINSNYYNFDEICYDQARKYITMRLEDGGYGSAVVDDIYTYLFYLDSNERERELPITGLNHDNYPINEMLALTNLNPLYESFDEDMDFEIQTEEDIDRILEKRRLEDDEKRIYDYRPYLTSLADEREIRDVQEKGAVNPFGHVGYIVDIGKDLAITWDGHPNEWDLIRNQSALTTTGMLEKLESELNIFDRYSAIGNTQREALSSIVKDIKEAYEQFDEIDKLVLVVRCLERIDSLMRNAGMTPENELKLLIERINSNHYQFNEECYARACKYVIWGINQGMNERTLVDEIYEYLYYLYTYEQDYGLPLPQIDPNNYPIKQIGLSTNIDTGNQTFTNIVDDNQSLSSESQSFSGSMVTHSQSGSPLAQSHSSGTSELNQTQPKRKRSANRTHSGGSTEKKTSRTRSHSNAKKPRKTKSPGTKNQAKTKAKSL